MCCGCHPIHSVHQLTCFGRLNKKDVEELTNKPMCPSSDFLGHRQTGYGFLWSLLVLSYTCCLEFKICHNVAVTISSK